LAEEGQPGLCLVKAGAVIVFEARKVDQENRLGGGEYI
jgi:hypothetical protein